MSELPRPADGQNDDATGAGLRPTRRQVLQFGAAVAGALGVGVLLPERALAAAAPIVPNPLPPSGFVNGGYPTTVAGARGLPTWFESNRVIGFGDPNVFVTNATYGYTSGSYTSGATAWKNLGGHSYLRHVKVHDEDPWWPSHYPAAANLTAARTNVWTQVCVGNGATLGTTSIALTAGQDLLTPIVADAHSNAMTVIGYYKDYPDARLADQPPGSGGIPGLIIKDRAGTVNLTSAGKWLDITDPAYAAVLAGRVGELAGTIDQFDGLYFDYIHLPTLDGPWGTYAWQSFPQHATLVGNYPNPTPALSGADPVVVAYRSWCADLIASTYAQALTAGRSANTNFVGIVGTAYLAALTLPYHRTSLPHQSHSIKLEWDTASNPGMTAGIFSGTSWYVPPSYTQQSLGWTVLRDSANGRPTHTWFAGAATNDQVLAATAGALAHGGVLAIGCPIAWQDDVRLSAPAAPPALFPPAVGQPSTPAEPSVVGSPGTYTKPDAATCAPLIGYWPEKLDPAAGKSYQPGVGGVPTATDPASRAVHPGSITPLALQYSFQLSDQVSPYLQDSVPLRHIAIHFSEAARDAAATSVSTGNPAVRSWQSVLWPLLGGYDLMTLRGVPVCSVDDGQLGDATINPSTGKYVSNGLMDYSVLYTPTNPTGTLGTIVSDWPGLKLSNPSGADWMSSATTNAAAKAAFIAQPNWGPAVNGAPVRLTRAGGTLNSTIAGQSVQPRVGFFVQAATSSHGVRLVVPIANDYAHVQVVHPTVAPSEYPLWQLDSSYNPAPVPINGPRPMPLNNLVLTWRKDIRLVGSTVGAPTAVFDAVTGANLLSGVTSPDADHYAVPIAPFQYLSTIVIEY